jgi:putative phosphoesterase
MIAISANASLCRESMRILLIADVHSNWPALSAIDETFDACLFAGDLVDYGPQPLPCIDWLRRHATAAVRGNHDHAVAQRVIGRGQTGFRRLASVTRPVHWDALDSRRMKYLARLPVTQHVRLGDLTFCLVHATPRDPLDEYLADDTTAWQDRIASVDADFVCVGHTHAPFHLDLGHIQVVNPGSVGQPRDGDPRLSYAIIEDGNVTFHRREYDIDATIAAMADTGVEDWVVRLTEKVLTSGGLLTKDEMDNVR